MASGGDKVSGEIRKELKCDTSSNSDDLSENAEEDSDDKSFKAKKESEPRRRQLSTSASVPLFEQNAMGGCEADLAESLMSTDFGGSEADLVRMESVAGIGMSQSYGQGASGHHKVQFRDEDKSPSGTETSGHKVSFSPVRMTGKDHRSPTRRKGRNRTLSENSTTSKTLSMASSVASMSPSTDSVYVAPDGGYGWVVVAASFFVNMIADGVTFSFGIMFEEFQTEFASSAAETAGVVSVFHAVPLLTGPIASWLTDRYGCRAVTIWGSIFASLGFLAAAFCHHIALLYFFFGIVSGFGLSLCYVASIIIVAYYFETKRSTATGIAVSGSGIGTFLFAPFTQWLMDSYGGWRGACIILSAIFLNMIICGLMFKELKWKKRVSRAGSVRSITSRTSQMPEIEELRIALQCGDVSDLINDKEEEGMRVSSLLTIPTYIKDPSKLPEDVLSLLLQNKQTYDFIQEKYPAALKDIRSAESLAMRGNGECNSDDASGDKTKLEKSETESKSVRLKRRVSSMMKGQKSILKKIDLNGSNMKQVVQRTPKKVKHIEDMKIRRQSMTCRAASRVVRRSTSCPEIYKSAEAEEDRSADTDFTEILTSVKECLSLHYVTAPFVLFCISNFLLYFWYDVPYVYTIEYVENNLKVPNSKSTQILSIIGILNTIGEVGVGWLSDQPWVSSIALYSLCMVICGLVTAIIPLVSSYPGILALSAAYGFCISANYSLTSPILVELVTIQQFSSAYGLLLACQGIANLLGPPFAGWLYDVSSEWYLTFGMCGAFIAISGLSLLIIPTITLLKKNLHNLRQCQDIEKRNLSPVLV